MIKTINKRINKINRAIGLDLVIKEPSKEALTMNQWINAAATVTCVSLGIVYSSKVLLGLGALSAAGMAIVQLEKKATS